MSELSTEELFHLTENTAIRGVANHIFPKPKL